MESGWPLQLLWDYGAHRMTCGELRQNVKKCLEGRMTINRDWFHNRVCENEPDFRLENGVDGVILVLENEWCSEEKNQIEKKF